MTPEHWRKVEAVFNAARAKAPGEREAFLDEACAGDPALRLEVESLMAYTSSRDGFPRDTPAPATETAETRTLVQSGAVLGPYRVESQLGAGGMGEVFRAVDTRLNRPVAIKVSRARFSERFRREAQALSALNSPHICTLFDVGPDFLVMELLDGETLQARLARGPLPLTETLRYGAQVADALADAHAKGITHRDLKPGNVMLTRSGVKVLDFGLAAVSGHSLTETGVVMGTPAYMAPEQQRGNDAGPQTDIYALGLVLHEMATGRRPQVVAGEPVTISGLPESLTHVLEKCLDENPQSRWQSAAEVRALLEWTAKAPKTSSAVSRRQWMWTAASALGGAALGAGVWAFRRTAPAAPEVLLDVAIPPPPNTSFRVAKNFDGGFALSPDGTMLAFVGRTDGVARLWVRRLDVHESRTLPGTEGAYYPFWSPDSKSVGFFTTSPSQLKRIDVDGGGARTLVTFRGRVPGSLGAWGAAGTILLRYPDQESLHRISENGGDTSPVLPGKNAGSASFLPDGKRFLYRPGGDVESQLMIATLDSDREPRELGTVGTWPQYSAGHILSFMNERLMAQAFDSEKEELVGQPFPVVDIAHQVFVTGGFRTTFSVTPGGKLVYPSLSHLNNRLVWRDYEGKLLSYAGAPGIYSSPRISPDGKRIAYSLRERGNTDLWIADLDNKAPIHLTFESSTEQYPVWSPDGQHLAFVSNRDGRIRDVYRMAASAGQPARRLTESSYYCQTIDWSSDGRHLAYVHINVSSRISIIPPDGGMSYEFLKDQAGNSQAQFDPGKPPRWLAYSSDDTSQWEVYVQAFVPGQPASGGREQISINGGKNPRWRADGRELFFIAHDGKVMAVDVNGSGANFQHSRPRHLFTTTAPEERNPEFPYDVTRDGKRFLMVEPAKEAESLPLTLLTDWLAIARK
jgi:serine/threonine protein kinase